MKLEFYTFDGFAPFEQPADMSDFKEDISLVKQKVEEFLAVLDNAKEEVQVTIRKQFARILENNFGRPILDEEGHIDSPVWNEEWKEIFQYLQHCHDVDIDDLDDCYRQWLKKLSIDGKNINLEKIFTCEEYRPIFNFNFKDEAMKEIQNIYIDYVNGGTNWKKRFAYTYTAFDNAKNQRTLYYLSKKYGPIPDFEQCIYPFKFGDKHFNTIIMNCDVYLLNLMYNKKVNEQEFFEEVLNIVSLPHTGYRLIDFCDAMESIIQCSFLSSVHKHQDIFIQAFDKIMKWIDFYPDYLSELLSLVAIIQQGIVLSDRLNLHNFDIRKKSLWVQNVYGWSK